MLNSNIMNSAAACSGGSGGSGMAMPKLKAVPAGAAQPKK